MSFGKLLAFALVGLVSSSTAWAGDRLELVRYVPLWKGSSVRSPDSSGIAFDSFRKRLLITDSEISEYGNQRDSDGELIFQDRNAFATDFALKTLSGRHLVAPIPGMPTEPVGITYNPVDDAFYVVDDDRKRIDRYPAAVDRPFDQPSASASTSVNGGYSDPEGITCDPVTGELFVVSGTKNERVLRFRYQAKDESFAYLGSFPVSERIRDPEGIACDPQSRNLFLVSSTGIAEFTQKGKFVQFFDYGFMKPHGQMLTAAGGGTFAPTSDPNDSPEEYALYVTCRGIDNGAFPEKDSLDGAVAELKLIRRPDLVSARDLAQAIKVPQDFRSVQAAIQASSPGQVILLAPGVYRENLNLSQKSVQLVSEYVHSRDEAKISQTVIDGGGADAAIEIPADARQGSRFIGLTIRNAEDGISAFVPFDLLHSHVTACDDGIDYERGGGFVRRCQFQQNRDDGIDLDGATAATIEFCEISDNQDDGIEIRLHPHRDPELKIVIRGNSIRRNLEDGIQLIGYKEATARRFRIERNLIIDNRMAGLGMMDGANTREDLQGALLPEVVEVLHNTFVGHRCHITGGANVLAANNVFVKAQVVSLRHVGEGSTVHNNLFWSNLADTEQTNSTDSLRVDPLLNDQFVPLAKSIVVDRGVVSVLHRAKATPILSPAQFEGKGPDLGAWEVRTLSGP